MATESETIKNSYKSIIKRVNTRNPFSIADEDCIVQSDVGKKLIRQEKLKLK